MTLDLQQLRALLEVLAAEGVLEFEQESDGTRLRIVRGRTAVEPAPTVHAPPIHMPTIRAPEPPADDVVDVTSPFVGTFYRAPSPDTPTFVEVGSVVRPGQSLCIIEAMKLMNEIESEHAGTVTEIFVQNGKAVEYGQKLFRIKRA